MTTHERWEKAIPYEATFWEDWLATKAFDDVAQYKRRTDPEAVLDEALITERFVDLSADEVAILDVGAGPLTTIGKVYQGKRLRIVAVDPLAENYDRILAAAGVTPPVRTESGEGERLLEKFEPASFDIAYAANALDHSYDPVLVIENMLDVVRPGGVVLLTHKRNEAESKGYLGLHQWNFENREGRFFIWNRAARQDVSALLESRAEVCCFDEGEYVQCVIRVGAVADSRL